MNKCNKNKIWVIKIGTSIISDKDRNISNDKIAKLAKQISKLISSGYGILIVSSGAILSGMNVLGMQNRPLDISQLQACAAVGQSHLMNIYSKIFKKFNYNVAQILLTQDDFNYRKRYINAKNTIEVLLQKKVIPIINENDTISTEEIKVGDNDNLSAFVATLIAAERLILLTDVDYFYEYSEKEKTKKPVSVITHITDTIRKSAGSAADSTRIGGMLTKVSAAEMVTKAGIYCHVMNGNKKDILLSLLENKSEGTVFLPSNIKTNQRKHWIAYATKSKGMLLVDTGAYDAINSKNRSLLATGIRHIIGVFNEGDIVSIAMENRKIFAKGVTNYSSGDLNKIKGLKSDEIKKVCPVCREVIHRDNLAII